ncbi:hypothetical protein QJS66_20235 [Kocuria rhizophila]|nr:hypothetical protein QJS66_20235 [Kocuria rhizophila]
MSTQGAPAMGRAPHRALAVGAAPWRWPWPRPTERRPSRRVRLVTA